MKPSQKICMLPFESAEISLNGNLYFCCPSWQKKPFGKISSQTIVEQWNSKAAQEIRHSILDGSYKYCDKVMCPYLQADNLKSLKELNPEQQMVILKEEVVLETPPMNLMLSYDQSCNLSCESCRVEKISYNVDSPEYKNLKMLTEQFTKDFFNQPSDRKLRLNITGSGDPFASVVFRQFLEELDGSKFPNLIIDLQTNGVLFTPIMWGRLYKIHKNIGQVMVSVDAATEATYTIVRRGGHWAQLLSNIEFLRKLRGEKKIGYLQLNFVVQKRNYFEMENFVKKFRLPDIDILYFSLIDDWGTWNKVGFANQAVWKKENSEFENFKKNLLSEVFDNRQVGLGNLTILRTSAIEEFISNMVFIQRFKFHFKVFFKKYYKKIKDFAFLVKKILSSA
jgi:MoaA/NifB/PqqE/SkfB family radical SAM enzyme